MDAERLSALIVGAGYGAGEPVIVGVRRSGAAPLFVAQGRTRAGTPASPTTLTYTASLSKQITAACAALLVRRDALDVEDAVTDWLPDLPAWAGAVRLRHLLHHTAALPDREVDALIGPTADRTSAGVLSTLARISAPAGRPGTTYAYSGVGYILLAAVVERAAGRPLPEFAEERIFIPLGMRGTRYWRGPEPAPPGALPLAASHPAPLSLGDGGVWSTAADLLRWSQALNADRLGISRLVQTPGRLDDGTPIDYAWGMGIRSHGGHRAYRHGGGWPGLRALLARVPGLDLSLVIIAFADDSERRVDLAAGILDLVTA
ncbi:MAG TPA: serine hydrolase domain-containing protein [Streptosporangiaceae bacterium]